MTSPPENVHVKCPGCGTVFEDWYRASINPDLDPTIAADDKYMREASTATCPKCKTTIGIAVGVRELALDLCNYDTDPPFPGDNRRGAEALHRAIDMGVLNDDEEGRAYQWMRFAGDARDIGPVTPPKDGDR